jgi:hypothetical protein
MATRTAISEKCDGEWKLDEYYVCDIGHVDTRVEVEVCRVTCDRQQGDNNGLRLPWCVYVYPYDKDEIGGDIIIPEVHVDRRVV